MESCNNQESNDLFDNSIMQLQKIAEDIVVLDYKFNCLELDMYDTTNYTSKLFIERQFEQLRAMLALKDNESHILIARSMFEGAVYLGCFVQNKELSDDWRNYSLVIDKGRLDELSDKSSVPKEVINLLNENKDIIESFKNKKGKFYNSWTKGKTIKELAEIAQLDSFYKNYYSSMCDYHHWGTKSFGIRYKYNDKQTGVEKLDTAEIRRDSFSAWCMSISSILSALKILSIKSNNDELKKIISKLEGELHNIPGTVSTNINYSCNNS